MIKRVVLPLFVCVLAACIASAATQTITLKSGRKITGEVTKTDKGYKVVTASGIPWEYPADQVASVVDVEDVLKEYKARLAKIDPNSADDHVALARWANDKGESDLAIKELREALKLDPNHEQAKLLMRVVQAKAIAATDEIVEPAPDAETTTKPSDKDLVSDEDIYRIRMYELSEKDQPQVEYRNQVLERFIKSASGNDEFRNDRDFEKKFRTWPRIRQITYIKDNGGDIPEILDDIIIKSDPKIIKEFQGSIWPAIAANCGQFKCHGAPGGQGGLIFFRTPGERTVYTNFLILNLWEKDGLKLIDRGNLDDSLLLQYGLPTAQAVSAHPTKLSSTLFTSTSSAQYKRFHGWLDRLTSSGTRQPDYRTKYQPPVGPKLQSGGQPVSLPADTTTQESGEVNPFD